MELQSTFVGNMKEKLDLVDSDLEIADVTRMFGSFVKFVVQSIHPTVVPAGIVDSIFNS